MTFLAKTGGCTGGRRLGYGQLEEAESEEKSPLRSGVLAMGGVGVLYNSYEGEKKENEKMDSLPQQTWWSHQGEVIHMDSITSMSKVLY